jgi:hypothetical protein
LRVSQSRIDRPPSNDQRTAVLALDSKITAEPSRAAYRVALAALTPLAIAKFFALCTQQISISDENL